MRKFLIGTMFMAGSLMNMTTFTLCGNDADIANSGEGKTLTAYVYVENNQKCWIQ